jgi:predicted amidohydrolase
MPNLNIAYIQAPLFWEDKAANLAHFEELLARVEPGTDLILLPETFTTGFPVDPKRFAESEYGPTMQWLQNQAKAKNAVICATFPLEQNGHYYNSLV